MSIWAIFQKLVSMLANPYRPEQHYMRGPGPKWIEAHGPVPVRTGRKPR